MAFLRKLFCKHCPFLKKNKYLEAEVMRLMRENEQLRREITYLEKTLVEYKICLYALKNKKLYKYKSPKITNGGENDGRD